LSFFWLTMNPEMTREVLRTARSNYRMLTRARQGRQGMTLMEILCVIAIIAILAAFYLGAISKAFVHVKKFLGN
jgi:prepilin-type N-terminal cleavage/methylation domain-containing protein